MLKDLLYISGFSLFVVIVMIFLNIYHINHTSTLTSNTQRHSIPITPTFDTKTLDSLKKRTPITIDLGEQSAVVSKDSVNSSSKSADIKISSKSSELEPPTPSVIQNQETTPTVTTPPAPSL